MNRSVVTAGRIRAVAVWAAVLAVVAALLTVPATAALAATPGAAFPPPGLLNDAALRAPATTATGAVYPGGLYAATAAQITSLRALETQAVGAVVHDHALRADDTAAVQSWARPDAEAQMWALLQRAVLAAKAGTADADQRNASAWFSAMLRRQAILTSQDAGREYVRWAGLGTAAYDALIATNPTEAQLNTFLSRPPSPYTNGATAQNPAASTDGGYCVYTSPQPYADEYDTNVFHFGKAAPTCFAPCPSLLGCPVDPPTYDQFVRWGTAVTLNTLFGRLRSSSSTESVAVGSVLAAVASAGSFSAGLGTTFVLGSTLSGTAFQTSVFPFAARVTQTTVTEAVDLAIAAGESVRDAATAVNAAATEIGGEVAATGVGVIVAAVIFAVTTAVQEGLDVAAAAELPGKLASLNAQARTNAPDPAAAASTGLYSLFSGATLPSPSFGTCDNQFLPTGAQLPTPCLNPTAVPAQTANDPQWVVTKIGPDNVTTTRSTLSWTDDSSGLVTTNYLHGNWFVHSATINGTAVATQSLRMHYTDWNGVGHTVWLFDNLPTPKFLTVRDSALGTTFDPATCVATGTCELTPTLQMLDENRFLMRVSATGGAESPPIPPQPVCAAGVTCTPSQTPSPTTLTGPAVVVAGDTATYTAHVGGGIDRTGTVAFDLAFSTPCPAAPLHDGTGVIVTGRDADCAITFPTPGRQFLFATYSGDEQHVPAQAAMTVDVLDRPPTTTTLTATTTSPVVGQPVVYTATVAPSRGARPTGTVTITDGGGTICAGATLTATAPYVATCTVTYSETRGPDTATAAYSGDPANFPSSGTLAFTIGKAPTTLTVTPAKTDPGLGELVDIVATVTVGAPSTLPPEPRGTVDFGVPRCTGVSTTATAVSGQRTARCTTAFTATGPAAVNASYSGDAVTTASSGTAQVQVGKAVSPTAVTVSNPTPVVGEPVTFTASITPPDGVTPTGTVTFGDAGGPICADVAIRVRLGAVTPYSATCTHAFTALGDGRVTATYSGDGNNLSSNGSVTFTVGQASSTTTVTPSSATPAVGQLVTYTATVAALPPDFQGPAPTGTVDFTGAPCKAVPLVNGAATCSITFTDLGTKDVSAAYSGDALTRASSGTVSVVVTKAATTTTVTASTATPVVGQPVTYTATVAASGPVVPAGTVTFSGGATCAGAALSTAAPYVATCTVTYLATGAKSVTATYSGGATTTGSSGTATSTVTKAPTSVALTPAQSSSTFGQQVVLTATVARQAPSTGGPASTGTVAFGLDNAPLGAAVPLSGAGASSAPITNLAPGTHTVTATYSGDAAYLGSTVSGGRTVTCSQTITSTFSGSLTVSGSGCVVGGSVSGSITVAPGGTLALVNARITGGITTNGSASILVCGSTVGGKSTLSGSTGPVAVGGTCARNTFSATLTVSGSKGPVTVAGNTVAGLLSVSSNTGGVTIAGNTLQAGLTVEGTTGPLAVTGNSIAGSVSITTTTSPSTVVVASNTIAGSLDCTQNTPAPTAPGGPNKVGGKASGQCAGLT